MASICLQRLRKEYKEIQRNPVEGIRAAPLENNLLEWHYVVEGSKGTPYEGGYYHGVLLFPKEYPYKPPSVLMYTPNGRFQEKTRLCLSMSDFHPELWNTNWSVSTIILGLLSFMNEETPTSGSITTSTKAKRIYAANSLAFNCKDKHFCALFPELVDLYEERMEKLNSESSSVNSSSSTTTTTTTTTATMLKEDVGDNSGWMSRWAIILAVLSFFSAALWMFIDDSVNSSG